MRVVSEIEEMRESEPTGEPLECVSANSLLRTDRTDRYQLDELEDFWDLGYCFDFWGRTV